MKWLMFALRLMALSMLFGMMGCGGGDPDIEASGGNYRLQFTLTNTSGAPVIFSTNDVVAGKSEDSTLASGGNDTSVLTSTYTSNATNIVVILYDNSSREITRLSANGVHIAENKTTYIYASYNGTHLNLEAGGQPQ